jgi:hypothetical protein
MAENSYQTQIYREAEEIEDYKLKLLQQAEALAFNELDPTAAPRKPLSELLPAYQIAGFTPAQLDALKATKDATIGSTFKDYLTAANTSLGGAYDTTQEAAAILRDADTRYQFGGAGTAIGKASGATGNITSGIGQINQGLGYLDLAGQRAAASDTTGQFGNARADLNTGLGALATGQNMAALSSQAELRPATAAIAQGIGGLTQAQQLALGSGAADFSGSQALLQQAGGRDLNRATRSYDPASASAFMDPYKQQVLDETIKQMDRQSKLAGQNLSAQAIRSGAFGGEREGVQRAEMERNLLDQKTAATANLLSQGYGQSQAQAMQAFEQQQARQMQAAGQRANIGQQVGAQAAQQAQLGQSAAGLYGNLAQQQAAAGQGLGQLGVQQAQLGQGAANIYSQAAQQYGNLASQGGALAGQESAINQNIANLMMQQSQARNQAAQTAAGIYGQQGQQYQGLAQGIGQLAGQQFNIAQQQAQGLGQLGGQLGQLGVQAGALGQTSQALQQGDINFLYNTGQAQQALDQQKLDAERATTLQTVYAPYQQAGFLSDIYKGAPSSQMLTSAASQPSASPFQQAVGIGLGAISTAAGAKKANLFG